MELDCPDEYSADKNILQEDGGSSFVGKLDLNLEMNKEGVEGHSHETEARGDIAQVEVNQQEHRGSSSVHTDVEDERLKSPYEKSNMESQLDLDEDNKKEFDYEVNDTGIGRFSEKSNTPVYEENLCSELEVGDPAPLVNFPTTMDSINQQESMKDVKSPDEEFEEYSSKFSENLQYERTDHENMERGGTERLIGKPYDGNGREKKDVGYSGKSLSDNGRLAGRSSDVHPRGRTRKRSLSPIREASCSPARAFEVEPAADRELSLSPRHHLSYPSPRLSRQRLSPSPGRPGRDSKRESSQDYPSFSARRPSTSPSRRSRRDSPPLRVDSVLKPTSPRRRHLSPDRRRHERSVSRSPTRQRGPSTGYRRDYRDRSRSPNAVNRYRRSPPRRYSPRHRSPPSGYNPPRRSPRRKPWSPPRNRNNGIGRPGNNLFVAGFNFVTTERDLERKFARFGRVRDVRIVRDKRSGDSRGFGFLSLERDEDADEAIRALDQTQWNGRVVLVEKSKTR